MNIIRLMLTLLLMISISSGVILALYSYKRRSIPGAKYFIIIVISMMTYDVAYIGELNSNQLETALFWFNFEHIPILTEPYFWVMMCLDYTRISKKYVRLFKFGMIPFLIFFYITYFTNNFHHLYISSIKLVNNGYFGVLVYNKEIIFFMLISYITICGVMSTALYIRGYIKSTRLHRYGYIIMVIASLFPWGAVYLNLTKINSLHLDLFPLVTIFPGILYLFGIFQHNIFKTLPIAAEMVYRLDGDGIAIIDITDRIIDVNEAFLEMFPKVDKLSKKFTLTSFIEDNPNLNGLSDKNNVIEYSLEFDNNVRYYTAELSEILTDNNLLIGKILYIRDVTLFVEHQKHLEAVALNAMKQAETSEVSFLQAQIKPHFLNNTLSIIAAMIMRDPPKAKELVINLSEFLVGCYKIDNSSPMVLLGQELEMVNTYVKIEKARFRERLNFQIICDNIPSVYIPRFSLQPIVENAIKHGILTKIKGGNVVIEINNSGDEILFQIKDDGVGITEDKIEALLRGSAENQGVGIINLHRRLLKYYGKGLNIQSIVGQGTTISFSMPMKYNNQSLERNRNIDESNCCG